MVPTPVYWMPGRPWSASVPLNEPPFGKSPSADRTMLLELLPVTVAPHIDILPPFAVKLSDDIPKLLKLRTEPGTVWLGVPKMRCPPSSVNERVEGSIPKARVPGAEVTLNCDPPIPVAYTNT